jgi:gamma-glutamyl phosphate reductase
MMPIDMISSSAVTRMKAIAAGRRCGAGAGINISSGRIDARGSER